MSTNTSTNASINVFSSASNGTQYATGWVSEPNGRGTWGLLYSCLFTLSLCVYSAIHLNIPPKGEKEMAQQRRMVKWVFIAIVAPEVVLFSAWKQYYVATQFCEKLYRLRLKAEGITVSGSLPSWRDSHWPFNLFSKSRGKSSDVESLPPKFSIIYGFYVVMGGLTVDISDIYDNVQTVTITPKGVLSMCESIPWRRFLVDDDTIRDKSKADNLAKVLVLFQVSWTLFQCISRQFSGLPLSVLEVHTMVHAVCAMFMYILWFKKPLNIRDATVLDLSAYTDQLALELMRSKASAGPPFNRFSSLRGYNSAGRYNENEWPREEASMLVFDIMRLNAALDNPQSSPAVGSILKDVSEIPTSPSSAAYEAVIPENQIPPGSAFPSKITGLYRSVADGVETKHILRTGDILWSGIGPMGHRSVPTDGRSTLAKHQVSTEFNELDKRLETMMAILWLPLHDGVHYKWHQTTFSLSEKDLLRWQRAATAFVGELAQRSFAGVVAERPEGSSEMPTIHNHEGMSPLSNIEGMERAGNDDLGGEPPQDMLIPGPATGVDTGPDPNHRVPIMEADSEATKDISPPSIGNSTPRLAKLSYHGKCYTPSFELEAAERTTRGYGTWGLRATSFGGAELVQRSENFELGMLKGAASGTVHTASLCVLSLVGGVYAGIHLALWNHQFPSRTEMLIWKISACSLGSPVVGYLTLFMLSDVWVFVKKRHRKYGYRRRVGETLTRVRLTINGPNEKRWLYKVARARCCPNPFAVVVKMLDVVLLWGTSHAKKILMPCFISILVAVGVLYVFSRPFIVVESFLALRLEPVGVYEDITWPQYIPHF